MPKTVPTSAKEYENSGGTHLSNVRQVSANLSPEIRSELFDDNRKVLPRILGPKAGQWTGYVRWDLWKVEITPRTHLFILSGKNGSSLEVTGDYETDADALRKYLQELGDSLGKERKKLEKKQENPEIG